MQNAQKPFCLAFSPLEYALRDIFYSHTPPQAACGGQPAQACSKRRGESANLNGFCA